MSDEFVAFPKIARLARQVIVTEKIDGTNTCILINQQGEIRAGSRSRWITVDDDK
ncbi:RNA ligase family protein [Herpetosiphon geysericola]|uniref:RNA ligase family protein n=1 Tax=Herpetosiphon geysericola TaxID=70996 RepID=UPI000B296B92|nr:RNA ligase family protein [Herpetosiphon geysericola]